MTAGTGNKNYSAPKEAFDVVITHGRVIDPESKLDAICNVGITAGRVAAISETPLLGKHTIDASGLVVTPGFIDLHTHTPTPLGERFQVLDGVTSAFDLEAGGYPVAAYGGRICASPRINFGASVGYSAIRLGVFDGLEVSDLVAGSASRKDAQAFTRVATQRELSLLRCDLESGLDSGGLGIGLLLDYMSDAIDDSELKMIFEVAARANAPIFVHVRRGKMGDVAGLSEMIRLASETGAPVHICHVNASAMGEVEAWLARIDDARAAGLDVTTELFPYTAGSTSIGAAVFGRDWRGIFGIDYSDVQWAATGEYCNEASWAKYSLECPSGYVIHHYMKEEWIHRALVHPGVMVASDAMPLISADTFVPPNGMGTFTRVIGRYARDLSLISLVEAVEKMTLLPARRLETISPTFRLKGRVQPGADADITIFDPVTVIDNADYRDPLVGATGVRHVLVNGVSVVRDGLLVEGVTPGSRVLAR